MQPRDRQLTLIRPIPFALRAHLFAILIVRALIRRVGNPERTGAYLAIRANASTPEDACVLHVEIERPHSGKRERYARLCVEKIVRTLGHPDHLTSSQSADEAQERYPGAVRGKAHAFGLSGFAGLEDEAAMLALAVMMDELPYSDAGGLASSLKVRPLFEHLLKEAYEGDVEYYP